MDPEPHYTSTPLSNTSPLSRLHLKHVLLCDWWLAWADEVDLAVSGLESRRGKLPRVFNSAKISKIDDASTLETVDGITVILNGILNMSRTLQNGFPHEVCSHFLNGFPHYWESYDTRRSEKLPKSIGLNKKFPFPASLLNLHVTRLRDFVMFQPMGSDNLLADILEDLGTSEGFEDDEIIDPPDNGNKERNKEHKDELTSVEEKDNNADLSDIYPVTSTPDAVITTSGRTRRTSISKNLTEETTVRTRSMTRLKKARKN